MLVVFFFFNDTATTEIYTLSLHDALPISRPYQKPHPPMWVAITSPGTEIDGADRGLGWLGLTFGGLEEQEKRIAEYRRRIKVCEPVGEVVNEQVNTVNFLYCHEDDATGVATGRRLQGTFGYMAAQLLSAREAYPTPSYPALGLLPQLRPDADSPGDSVRVPDGLCIGSPDRIIEAIKKWESVGADRVNFLLNAMEVVPQEEVLASLRLFAKEVMPKFAKTESAEPAAV